jgi:hypothetical protein
MNLKLFFLPLCLIVFHVNSHAETDFVGGTVRAARGSIQATGPHGQALNPLVPGAILPAGTALMTGTEASLTVDLSDGAWLALGPESKGRLGKITVDATTKYGGAEFILISGSALLNSSGPHASSGLQTSSINVKPAPWSSLHVDQNTGSLVILEGHAMTMIRSNAQRPDQIIDQAARGPLFLSPGYYDAITGSQRRSAYEASLQETKAVLYQTMNILESDGLGVLNRFNGTTNQPQPGASKTPPAPPKRTGPPRPSPISR